MESKMIVEIIQLRWIRSMEIKRLTDLLERLNTNILSLRFVFHVY